MSTDEANTQYGDSRKSKSGTLRLCIGSYVAGWLLIYFGVVGALPDYGQTGRWHLKPDHHFFDRFVSAALTLVLSGLVGLFLMWASIPLLAIVNWLLELPQR